MKIGNLMNEIFDIASLKQTKDIQGSIQKLSDFVNKNPGASKDISTNVSDINTNFAAILAQIQTQQAAEEQEKKRKEQEEKVKQLQQAKQRAGIGSTIPVTPVQGTNTPTNINTKTS